MGLDPFPPSPIPGGPALLAGRLSKLTSSAACPSFPMWLEQEAVPVANPSFYQPVRPELAHSSGGPYAVARPLGGLGLPRTPGIACKKTCVSVYPREEEPTVSIGFPQGLRPVGSSEFLVCQHKAGPLWAPKSLRLETAKTQAHRGVLDPGVCPHTLCPAPGRGHCGAWFPAWFPTGHPVWAKTGFDMSP